MRAPISGRCGQGSLKSATFKCESQVPDSGKLRGDNAGDGTHAGGKCPCPILGVIPGHSLSVCGRCVNGLSVNVSHHQIRSRLLAVFNPVLFRSRSGRSEFQEPLSLGEPSVYGQEPFYLWAQAPCSLY
jgi:hypothetical protein